MKRSDFHISPYIIIPVIFAGMTAFSGIVSFRITENYMGHGDHYSLPVLMWTGIIAVCAFFCGLLVVRVILGPVKRFIQETEKFPIMAIPDSENREERSTDEIKYYTEVFEHVTDVLSKVEARLLFPRIIGQSKAIRGILSQIMKVAPADSTVLISGDSGTGKELVAASIHEHSLRKGQRFVKLNCVAIPEGLLESELFGHERGAFTGATARKIGKFEIADGGTLFLDEIGDMPLNTQAKILRVLQEREFERIGGTKTIQVNVRFIAATNKNLLKMVEDGLFRQDLYYRLNVFSIHLPPLRERREDIPLLADHFLKNEAKAVQIAPSAMQWLMAYSWLGNVRELQNAIERAAVMCENGVIEMKHLPLSLTKQSRLLGLEPINERLSIDDQLKDIEKALIIEALRNTDGVQVRAAEILGINQRSLWHRIKKHNIDVALFKN